MLKKGSSSDRMTSSGKTYSTFVDNVTPTPHSNANFIDENSTSTMSRKSSTVSLQQQQRPLPTTSSMTSFNQKTLPVTSSTSSFQRHYTKPPVIPTTTSPLHHRENFVAGTGSYSRSRDVSKMTIRFERIKYFVQFVIAVSFLKHLLLKACWVPPNSS